MSSNEEECQGKFGGRWIRVLTGIDYCPALIIVMGISRCVTDIPFLYENMEQAMGYKR